MRNNSAGATEGAPDLVALDVASDTDSDDDLPDVNATSSRRCAILINIIVMNVIYCLSFIITTHSYRRRSSRRTEEDSENLPDLLEDAGSDTDDDFPDGSATSSRRF